jgi:ankyrin repeat/BTB/POZ domain-containing protein 1
MLFQTYGRYGVWKLREHCLDAMAVNFEIFASTPEFRRMLLCLPPPSGDLTERTTAPKAPGVEDGGQAGENALDDLREKWLTEEGSELDKRDESALEFDKRLAQLVALAEEEESQNEDSSL